MGTAISIEDLSFTYPGGSAPVLNHVDGNVEEGSFVLLMGHGGAGKSTLCCTLNALVPNFFRGRYQGRVLVMGKEVARQKTMEMSQWVGLVFQDFEAQLFSTNVELEMAFGPENHRLDRYEIERRIQRYLRFVGLEKVRHREPATLSGGQKQRLAIGSILALEPSILVMDEPTTDLDPKGRNDVLSLADHLQERGQTLMVVDHEPETAVKADQIWLMADGQIISKGAPFEVLTNPFLMESCGIKPHPLVELFHLMGWPGRPLTDEAAIALIEKDSLIRPDQRKIRTLPYGKGKTCPIFSVEGLRYVYPNDRVEALKGVDLSIYEGEFIALLGQNGSGKTTLAKHLKGLLHPTAGKLWISGRSASQYRPAELARIAGYVFQNPDHQIFARTVLDEVGFGLKVLGEPSGVIERRVTETLENVGLSGYETRVPFALTKGERQRVAVASVLAPQPQVIILDEPTTGLDYPQQCAMMEMLKGLNQAGHTIIIITHSMSVAAEYATRTIVMKDGAILLDGATRSVFRKETQLAEASLYPSSLVRLSNRLGTEGLTVEQMVKELKNRAREET